MNDERRKALENAGQGHVLERLDRLDGPAKEALLAQLADVDLALLARLAEQARRPADVGKAPDFQPPELFPLRPTGAQQDEAERARERGRELLSAGQVGYVLVAGGQASRLGYDGPKGGFPVGPVTGRTLFEFHARRLLKATRGRTVRTPWYVMTSPANDAATRQIFADHGYFGLDPEDVHFFAQRMLPALDAEGRILFSAKDSLFLAPNGHGGVLSGLRESGAIDDMRARGITQLSYFQVDNPLVRPADPLFLGLHDLAGAGMSSKVVRKRDAGEKVGVIGRVDGALGCIEYSDLPESLREARGPDGELAFGAGNIAVHAISVDFLDELTSGELELPWHVAKKVMQTVDANGNPVETPGFKFETFVFDALARSEKSITLEVDRREEFSPVKNKEGEDSPQTARAALLELHGGWVKKAGLAPPPVGEDGLPLVEVDPLLAETEEEFLARGTLSPDAQANGHYYG